MGNTRRNRANTRNLDPNPAEKLLKHQRLSIEIPNSVRVFCAAPAHLLGIFGQRPKFHLWPAPAGAAITRWGDGVLAAEDVAGEHNKERPRATLGALVMNLMAY